MRVWHKPVVGPADEPLPTGRDATFSDHARGMGGYRCAGYGSVDEFYATHFLPFARLQHYDAFLRDHLPKEARTLSIASGRCANELRLASDGYDITCSDLEAVCPAETRALFPAYRFIAWNALSDPLPAGDYDAAISLSFMYLLEPDALDRFFARVGTLLTRGGLFILDAAGAPDHPLANAIHDVAVPFEARLSCAAANVRALLTKRARCVVRLKHHGYRYRDDELVAAAARHGFTVGARAHMDFENEWTRLYVYRRAIRPIAPLRSAMCRLGRAIPYVRMFAFRRA
jgi:SAM-dependent methyltransferase